jgi:hypothetical protein
LIRTSNQHLRKSVQTEHNSSQGKTDDHVAAKAGFTDGRTEVLRVSKVMENGVPELVEAMAREEIPGGPWRP